MRAHPCQATYMMTAAAATAMMHMGKNCAFSFVRKWGRLRSLASSLSRLIHCKCWPRGLVERPSRADSHVYSYRIPPAEQEVRYVREIRRRKNAPDKSNSSLTRRLARPWNGLRGHIAMLATTATTLGTRPVCGIFVSMNGTPMQPSSSFYIRHFATANANVWARRASVGGRERATLNGGISISLPLSFIDQEPGVILLGNGLGGSSSADGGASSEDDEDGQDSENSDYDVHRAVSPCRVTFVGANAGTGKSSLRSKPKDKKVCTYVTSQSEGIHNIRPWESAFPSKAASFWSLALADAASAAAAFPRDVLTLPNSFWPL